MLVTFESLLMWCCENRNFHRWITLMRLPIKSVRSSLRLSRISLIAYLDYNRLFQYVWLWNITEKCMKYRWQAGCWRSIRKHVLALLWIIRRSILWGFMRIKMVYGQDVSFCEELKIWDDLHKGRGPEHKEENGNTLPSKLHGGAIRR